MDPKTFPKVVRFEVLTLVVMKSTISREITPCSPLEVNRRFGWTYSHLQGLRISQQENSVNVGGKLSHLLSRWFLAWLILRPKMEAVPRNVGWLSTDYTALYLRRCTLRFQKSFARDNCMRKPTGHQSSNSNWDGNTLLDMITVTIWSGSKNIIFAVVLKHVCPYLIK
jgi:hypothetical protein